MQVGMPTFRTAPDAHERALRAAEHPVLCASRRSSSSVPQARSQRCGVVGRAGSHSASQSASRDRTRAPDHQARAQRPEWRPRLLLTAGVECLVPAGVDSAPERLILQVLVILAREGALQARTRPTESRMGERWAERGGQDRLSQLGIRALQRAACVREGSTNRYAAALTSCLACARAILLSSRGRSEARWPALRPLACVASRAVTSLLVTPLLALCYPSRRQRARRYPSRCDPSRHHPSHRYPSH
jgi:hypothetical protein